MNFSKRNKSSKDSNNNSNNSDYDEQSRDSISTINPKYTNPSFSLTIDRSNSTTSLSLSSLSASTATNPNFTLSNSSSSSTNNNNNNNNNSLTFSNPTFTNPPFTNPAYTNPAYTNPAFATSFSSAPTTQSTQFTNEIINHNSPYTPYVELNDDSSQALQLSINTNDSNPTTSYGINQSSQINAEPAAFPAPYYSLQHTKEPFSSNLLYQPLIFDHLLEKYPLRTRHHTRITHGTDYVPCWKHLLSQRTIAKLPRCCDAFGIYKLARIDSCFYIFGLIVPLFILSILINLNRNVYNHTPKWLQDLQIIHPYVLICILPIVLAIFTVVISIIHNTTRVVPIKMIHHGPRRTEIAKIERILTNFGTKFIEPRLKIKIQYYHLRSTVKNANRFRSNIAWGLGDKTTNSKKKKLERILDGTKEYLVPILSYKRLTNITAKEYTSRLHEYVNCGQAILSVTTQCKLVNNQQKQELERIMTFLKSKPPKDVYPNATHSKVRIVYQSVKPLTKKEIIDARSRWDRYLVKYSSMVQKIRDTHPHNPTDIPSPSHTPNSPNYHYSYSYHYNQYEETDVEDESPYNNTSTDSSQQRSRSGSTKNDSNTKSSHNPLFSSGIHHSEEGDTTGLLLQPKKTPSTTSLSNGITPKKLPRQPTLPGLDFSTPSAIAGTYIGQSYDDINNNDDQEEEMLMKQLINNNKNNNRSRKNSYHSLLNDDDDDDDDDDHGLEGYDDDNDERDVIQLTNTPSTNRYQLHLSHCGSSGGNSSNHDVTNISGFVLTANHDNYDPLQVSGDEDSITAFPRRRQFVINEDSTTQTVIEKVVSWFNWFQSSIYRSWIFYALISLVPCLPFLTPRVYRYANRDIAYKHSFAVTIPSAETWIAVWENPKLRRLVLRSTRPGDIDNPG